MKFACGCGFANFTGQAGWAQVNGRNAISWEDKFNLDVWYVDKIAAPVEHPEGARFNWAGKNRKMV